MPHPEENETKENFMSRCMAYPDMQKHPEDQRAAICYSLWDEPKDKNEMPLEADFNPMITACTDCFQVPCVCESYKMKKYKYVDIKNVPIFDQDDEYDEVKLHWICEINNARTLDTGEQCPITLGHTKEDAPEEDQPTTVGYADNYRIDTIGNLKPRNCIVADFHIDEEHEEEVKDYKNRSVELWTNDGVFHPIALLKTSRPAKNLGVMNFQVENKNKLRKYYLEENEENEMSPDQIAKIVLDTINQSEWAAAVKKIMEQQSKMEMEKTMVGELDEPTPQDEMPNADPLNDKTVDGKPDPLESADEIPKEDEEQVPKQEEELDPADEEVVKKDAMATPGAYNTFVPEVLGDKKKDKTDIKETKINEMDDMEEMKKKKKSMEDSVAKYKMDFEVQKSVAEKYAAEFNKMVEERNELGNRLTFSQRQTELLKLSYEFNFNPDDEAAICRDFSEPQFKQHCDLIKSRYNKVPIHRGFVNPVTEIKDNKITSDKVLEIVRYASKHNKTFEQARAEVMEVK